MTAADKAKADDTMRIRTSAADQPWKRQGAADEASENGKPDVGGPTAQYPRPAGLGTSTPPVDNRRPSVDNGRSSLDGGSARGLSFGPAGERVEPARDPGKDAKGKDRKPAGVRPPRKAHLVLRRIEPWSAMKFSFVVSLVCFVVLFVAVAVLYGVLSALGVFSSITDTVNQLTSGAGGAGAGTIDIASWFEPVRILGYAALLGALNVVLITALSTLGAVIYNISADLVGGVEVTFSEAE
ncbi:hypothetical protein GCM10010116_60870 [Microbispora rosea subsp. aerata]|nr:DUF3566 domain-containing protein [Microbispora rosea]GGO30399.1 hypothetical protein GCM10010116_60870 [Microbispora rosea subsp. aerata]GIH59080.1 hypothetical protein Mro02_59940 [Microbispora rosea subsp. aerata]GLJ85879.1 hypothetical protein GCM10017588_46120 [Microbispora rosea subsp. aerata]